VPFDPLKPSKPYIEPHKEEEEKSKKGKSVKKKTKIDNFPSRNIL